MLEDAKSAAARHHGRLSARFAAIRDRVADGTPAIGAIAPTCRARVWLAGEHRPGGEHKLHLPNLPG